MLNLKRPHTVPMILALMIMGEFPCRTTHAQYAVTDLGLKTEPTAINNRGQIVIGDSIRNPNGAMTKIGVLRGDTASYFTSISDAGDVVGYSANALSSSAPWHAFVYVQSTGKLINIGTNAQAYGINNLNEIIGSFPKANDTLAFEVLWTGGQVMRLAAIPASDDVEAYGINAAGSVVGTLTTPTGSFAFLYNGGHFHNIGTFQPAAINSAGQIVGQNNGFACLYAAGHLRNLGAFAGTVSSDALFINDSSEILGSCRPGNPNAHPSQPFIYKGGEMLHLTIPGWIVSVVSGLNNSGQIIAEGFTPDQLVNYDTARLQGHGLLLTPKR
jgi:probable HAF family extracellular repeat protein